MVNINISTMRCNNYQTTKMKYFFPLLSGDSGIGFVFRDVAHDDISGNGKILLNWISKGMKI